MNLYRRRQQVPEPGLLQAVVAIDPTCCRCGSGPCVAVIAHPVPAPTLRALGIDPRDPDRCRGVCSRCAAAARARRPRRFAISAGAGGRA
ncbi:hypothetical protein Krad_4701 (plasmid) [Kineococcus radiotolerans SRS30216 = ATCC BAA-149]|uniref:Uncharacterized protein n=1 Tax=Kineococcus radiotolerans (strain ATCC BAA-149 / DSM 14245 / SRS30216) TaxID=266940 RepID=A6WH70_KINRD|nr:hypothetical protein Krad_4701 [Kineococcus radiotolerans SRS30216 = ATCC BAA-149]